MPGVWMINQKRWAVIRSEISFDPTDLQGVPGHLIQGADGKWSIEGDPNRRGYAIARGTASRKGDSMFSHSFSVPFLLAVFGGELRDYAAAASPVRSSNWVCSVSTLS